MQHTKIAYIKQYIINKSKDSTQKTIYNKRDKVQWW